MRLIAVNVGKARQVEWNGGTVVATGIFKEPVDHAVQLRRLNLDGDEQADLEVHGGPDKAVYAYPAEHYEFWRTELPDADLPWGAFGENFTTEGMLEGTVRIGDRFQIGSATLTVTQPRMPCFKLGIKFGTSDMIKRFLASRRTGFYFSVLEEGEVRVGNTIEPVGSIQNSMTVADITELYVDKSPNPDSLRAAAGLAALPTGWRDYFLRKLGKASGAVASDS